MDLAKDKIEPQKDKMSLWDLIPIEINECD